MNTLMKMTIISAVASTLALSGCGNGSSTPETPAHTDDDGHDHQAAGHEDHDHANEDDEHADHDDHDHGEEVSLGTIEIVGTVLDVSISGQVAPGEEVHIDLVHTAGPLPAAVRLWIGDEAATGSLKSKADGHDNHFHGHAEAPASLQNAALWIEVESASGNRTARSLPLP